MRLTVETGPLAGIVVTLDRDHPTTLGKGSDCALRIQEAGVADQHAVVKALKGEGFGIKALAPGLRVNGAEVEASPLKDGDVIELGTTRVAFGEVQQHGLPRVSGYRILDVLGKGGMGVVYRAEQVSLHRQVALKVLNQERTRDPNFVARFVAEARAAAKLQHPNVVSVFDVEHDGDTYYYAMELMHDGSCEDWLKQNGAMPVDRALRVIADAAAGLAYAESLGIVHRDIKPDNLMLDQHGAVKIADLGLASQAEISEDRAIGTPHFMAPEQVLKHELDHRTDLYALGCTFYRLVTGRTPFRGQTVKDILRAQVKEDAEPAHKVNPAVPVEVSNIIQRLMAKQPADRFQTANELLEALDVLLQPPVKRGLWIALAVAAVVIAGGAIYWAVNKPDKVIKEVVQYDDPEKQEFADRIKLLEREAADARATIALLTARVSGQEGEALAASFDRVAAEHAGTAAAAEATERAAAIRRQLADRERAQEARRARIVEHVATVRRATLQPLDAGNFTAALATLDGAPPADLAGDEALVAGIDKLRAEIVAKARERLRALCAAVAAKPDPADEPALAGAIDALAAALATRQVWPQALADDVAEAEARLATARSALTELQNSRIDTVWRDYQNLLLAPDGVRALLRRLDLQRAAELAIAFADGAKAKAAAERARGLAAVLQHAEAFAAALGGAIAGGDLEFTIDDRTLQVAQWDRSAHQLVLTDPSRRGAKDVLRPTDGLAYADWQSLADQVAKAPPGSRECFLALLALDAHAEAAAAYLRRLDRNDDQSGTGSAAYPYGADVFDSLLRQLPQGGDEPWIAAVRTELYAGLRLATGLRALSERRNLAAAGHLDKLLADHPHSFLVSVLQ